MSIIKLIGGVCLAILLTLMIIPLGIVEAYWNALADKRLPFDIKG